MTIRIHKKENMSSSSSLTSKLAFMDDSDEEQGKHEDMLLASCLLK